MKALAPGDVAIIPAVDRVSRDALRRATGERLYLTDYPTFMCRLEPCSQFSSLLA